MYFDFFFLQRKKILNTVNYFYSLASFVCENRHNFRDFFLGGEGGGARDFSVYCFLIIMINIIKYYIGLLAQQKNFYRESVNHW